MVKGRSLSKSPFDTAQIMKLGPIFQGASNKQYANLAFFCLRDFPENIRVAFVWVGNISMNSVRVCWDTKPASFTMKLKGFVFGASPILG